MYQRNTKGYIDKTLEKKKRQEYKKKIIEQ